MPMPVVPDTLIVPVVQDTLTMPMPVVQDNAGGLRHINNAGGVDSFLNSCAVLLWCFVFFLSKCIVIYSSFALHLGISTPTYPPTPSLLFLSFFLPSLNSQHLSIAAFDKHSTALKLTVLKIFRHSLNGRHWSRHCHQQRWK